MNDFITIPFQPGDDIKEQTSHLHHPGVWLLIGENAESKSPISLQVAQSKDIGAEILDDSKDLSYEKPLPVLKDYVNKFGEKQFEYEDYPCWSAKNLYHEIACNYKRLKFICIAAGPSFDKKEFREKIEKYVAYATLCKYWRDSARTYKPRSAKEIEQLKNDYLEESHNLRKDLCESRDVDIDAIDQYLKKIGVDCR